MGEQGLDLLLGVFEGLAEAGYQLGPETLHQR